MKFLILLYVLLTGCIPIVLHAQENNRGTEETIETSFSSASVSEWFDWIEQKGITLAYNPSLIRMEKQCHIDKKRMSIGELLRSVLDGYKVTLFNAASRKIIISVQPLNNYQISGMLREAQTLEQLYGATVTFRQNGKIVRGTVSNETGFYRLTLPEGTYQLEASYLGYDTRQRTLHVNGDQTVNLELVPVTVALNEVVITPRHTVDKELYEASPSNMLAFSSTDLFAETKILPGVMTGQAGDEMQVNGGNGDENLFLLEGIPVYHNNHVNPMLPIFNGDAIKNVTFHRHFFPTQFEGRLSSVIDIKLKEGNKSKHMRTLTLDMPSASVMLEGPIVKEKMSYMVSGRRSWIDLLNGVFSEKEETNHTFYDFNAKLHYNIHPKLNLQFIGYHATDNYYAAMETHRRQRVLHWTNELYALKLSSELSRRLLNTTTLAYTNYRNAASADALGLDADHSLSAIVKEFSITSFFNYQIANLYKINFGIKGSYEQFRFSATEREEKDKTYTIQQISAFYDNEIQLSSALHGQIGVNVLTYVPKGNTTYCSIQPRFSLKYNIGNQQLYAGVSQMAQFYHYLRVDALSIPLPTDFRMPTVEGFKPSTSHHYEIGWKYLSEKKTIDASIYYKRRKNIIALRPDIYPENEKWNKEYTMTGNGESYGLKIYFFKEWRRLSTQLSYTWSASHEKYPLIRNGASVHSFYDIPHLLSSAFSYKIAKTSTISTGIQLHSGRVKNLLYFDSEQSVMALKNFRSERYPFSYRVDASYTYSKYFPHLNRKFMFRAGLYNLVGNPTEEDFLNSYSINIGRNCVPYGTITWKF